MHQKSGVETGLFMVGHRYYNPEWGRWLSPDDIEYLDPHSINGLNLYAYCFNNPVMNYDPSGHEPLTILMIVLLSSLIGVTILAVDSPNAEITGPSFDDPTFFSASEKGFNIISGGGNLGKKTWYLDDNKNSSFYFQGFSGELSLGIPYDISSVKDLLGANLYLFKFGYDGKYLDIGIPLGFDPEFVSIDFSQIYKDIKSLFN